MAYSYSFKRSAIALPEYMRVRGSRTDQVSRAQPSPPTARPPLKGGPATLQYKLAKYSGPTPLAAALPRATFQYMPWTFDVIVTKLTLS